MDLKKITAGSPKKFNVIIEIPAGSVNKYEYDEESRVFKLDFVFRGGFHFPFNYGFIPHTLAEDKDPLDAVVLSSGPIEQGTVVVCLPVAILKLKDRGEQDDKIIAVPECDVLSEKFKSLADINDLKKSEIIDFFKGVGVQKNKTMDIEGFFDKEEAMTEVEKYKL